MNERGTSYKRVRRAEVQGNKKSVKTSVRMLDVAARAGVSVMTVSRALSDPDKVSKETLKRVRAAVDDVRYVPNEMAGNLSSRRSKAVGLIVPNINNSLYSSTIQAISTTLRERGFQLMIADSGLSLDDEELAITGFLAQRVCGLILHNTQHTARARELISQIDVPTIEIGNLTEEPLDQCVSYSNFAAAKAMTIHLGRLGYRRIGFVSLALRNNDRAQIRYHGYVAGIEDLGLPQDASLAIEAESGLQGGADALKRLLASHPKIDAIFFSADVMAVGALLECQRRGWKVPSRVAIASFDDLDLLRHVVPAITTLRIPREEIGRRSAEMLIARLEGRTTPKVMDLGFDIIQREST
jgi:LacI family gluconate utilization system Gnt-I transcriptional repressor